MWATLAKVRSSKHIGQGLTSCQHLVIAQECTHKLTVSLGQWLRDDASSSEILEMPLWTRSRR